MKKENRIIKKDKAGKRDAWRSWYIRKEKIDQDMSRLARIFKKKDVSKILDAGCGTGRHAIYFAQRGFKVYGFDFSNFAIKQTKRRLKQKGLQANLKIWDIRKKFPYPSGFFDVVLSIRVFHHNPLKIIKKIVKEFSRVLKKSGYIYIQIPPRHSVFKYAMFASKKGKPQIKLEGGTYVPVDGPEKGVPHHGFTKTELRKLFSDFEIKKISLRERQYNLLGVKR